MRSTGIGKNICGAMMTMGRGAIINASRKHKLNIGSYTVRLTPSSARVADNCLIFVEEDQVDRFLVGGVSQFPWQQMIKEHEKYHSDDKEGTLGRRR